jgi:RNA polymerase sigma-70 factor, ECF subfamily
VELSERKNRDYKFATAQLGFLQLSGFSLKKAISVGCRSPPTSFRFSNFKIETEEIIMANINLRDFYPFYSSDFFIEVPDEVEATLMEAERLEKNYTRRSYYNKAYYSLDADDGIESDILFVSLSPCEIYERKLTVEQLHVAIASLPDKQAKRIYAHYILGMSEASIAKAEGVSKSSISESIKRGLRSMEIFLKNFL